MGQFLHETILIPFVMLKRNKSLIHSSGVTNGKRAVLIGGTGGVGKTSTLLNLAKMDENISFLNDDMAVLDSEGFAYPNFAYPKIYAYNTINNPYLERLILEKRSFLNKLHWKKRSKKNKAGVRRRISPVKLFKGPIITDKTKIDSIMILNRTFDKDVSIKKRDIKWLNEVMNRIILTEYFNAFNRYYLWFEVNSLYNNFDDLSPMFKTRNFDSKFNPIIKQVNIPVSMEHSHLKNTLTSIINEELYGKE